ncbi:MAG: hypothetical protein ACO3JL_21590 [Myxococcota bacterium]
MSAIADLSLLDAPPFWEPECAPVPTSLRMHAVGWLGSHNSREGSTPAGVIDRLVAAELAHEFFSDHSLGWHCCDLCAAPADRPRHTWKDASFDTYGHGFLVVEHEGRAFVAPRLLPHYILAHQYRPPDEFIAAVHHGRFLRPPPLTPGQVALVEEAARRRPPPSRWRSELGQFFVGVLFSVLVLLLMRVFGALGRRRRAP